MSATAAAVSVLPARRSGYLVGPAYDSVFFIGSPLIALLLGVWISRTTIATGTVEIFTHRASLATIFIGSFTSAHLFIVFFRSHVNRDIFKTHPLRFTLVPVLLLLAMTMSLWVQCAVAVLGTFWDVYHSSLQTFGLGRIYDRLAGNDPRKGRRLDMMLNLLLYAGPIVAGVSLMKHVNDFKTFRSVGSVFFASIPARTEALHPYLALGVIAVGVPFIGYYLARYALMARAGYKVSPKKVALFSATAFCSIYTWTFDSFGQAFFIMNFFHALQYFALVWHSEKVGMARFFRLGSSRWGMILTLAGFLMVGALYGVSAELFASRGGLLLSLFIVVSIMHFWWDGFIWSVRKRQI